MFIKILTEASPKEVQECLFIIFLIPGNSWGTPGHGHFWNPTRLVALLWGTCLFAANSYLVGGLEHGWIMTFHILGISSSQLTNSYFSEGQVYHQPEISIHPLKQIPLRIQLLGRLLRLKPSEGTFEGADERIVSLLRRHGARTDGADHPCGAAAKKGDQCSCAPFWCSFPARAARLKTNDAVFRSRVPNISRFHGLEASKNAGEWDEFMDSLKTKTTQNHGVYHEIWGCPAKCT